MIGAYSLTQIHIFAPLVVAELNVILDRLAKTINRKIFL